MGKALLLVVIIGAAVLWWVSNKTGTNFQRTTAMRQAGGHSILKRDPAPQPIRIVGSWVKAEGEVSGSSGTILIQGRTEDCDANVPGCLPSEQLMMIHNPDPELVRARPPFYRGTHYFMGIGELRSDDSPVPRRLYHYGSLAQAKEKH